MTTTRKHSKDAKIEMGPIFSKGPNCFAVLFFFSAANSFRAGPLRHSASGIRQMQDVAMHAGGAFFVGEVGCGPMGSLASRHVPSGIPCVLSANGMLFLSVLFSSAPPTKYGAACAADRSSGGVAPS